MKPLLTGFAIAGAILIALPLTQYIDQVRPDQMGIEPAQDYLRPPEWIIEPPKPTVEDKVQIEKLVTPPPKMTIEQFEYANLPVDTSGFWNGTPVWVPETAVGPEIVDIAKLTIRPRPIRQPSPIYPPAAKHANLEGQVVLQFIVDTEGQTSRITVLRSSDRIFETAAINAVRRWVFTPGEKDGRIVQTRVRIPIPFQISH